MKKKILVAMSGGVDSSVAAYLLKEQGYEVSGAIMRLWNSSVEDAQKVADSLSVPLYVFDMESEFNDEIINYFVTSYLKGSTPNPCIECNRKFKFGRFMEMALGMGFDYIATGHYAGIEFSESSNSYHIIQSNNILKDQSYFLYNMTQEQLKHTVFPIGNFNKDKIRELAQNVGLSVAEKKDSQDICFIPDGKYGRFISGRIGDKDTSGNFVDVNGTVLGKHNGIINFTIGQRNGFGMGFGKKMYVISIDPKNNNVILGDDSEVYACEMVTDDFFFTEGKIPDNTRDITVKIRYGAVPASCNIYSIGPGNIKIVFNSPVRALTKGQSAVFYENNKILGGAIIK